MCHSCKMSNHNAERTYSWHGESEEISEQIPKQKSKMEIVKNIYIYRYRYKEKYSVS